MCNVCVCVQCLLFNVMIMKYNNDLLMSININILIILIYNNTIILIIQY